MQKEQGNKYKYELTNLAVLNEKLKTLLNISALNGYRDSLSSPKHCTQHFQYRTKNSL